MSFTNVILFRILIIVILFSIVFIYAGYHLTAFVMTITNDIHPENAFNFTSQLNTLNKKTDKLSKYHDQFKSKQLQKRKMRRNFNHLNSIRRYKNRQNTKNESITNPNNKRIKIRNRYRSKFGNLKLFSRKKTNIQPIIRDESWTKNNSNKLIIFLHFHKAGGTSLIDAARSVTIFHSREWNGNPKVGVRGKRGRKTERIPFWEYTATQMISFISNCKTENVSFIAMENSYFTYSSTINSISFKSKYKVELIILFRNPFDRFISNFFYAGKIRKTYKESKKRRSLNIVERLLAFHNDPGAYKQGFYCESAWNMYVRIFTLKYDRDYDVTENDLKIAKGELNKFDVILILERNETHKLLETKYGIKMKHSEHNSNPNKFIGLGTSNINLLLEWKTAFQIFNKFDYMLYNYAVELSLAMS